MLIGEIDVRPADGTFRTSLAHFGAPCSGMS
jgi:hypothetical protein